MDLKKKYNEIKTKIKPYAPAIVTAVSTGTAIALAVVNHRLNDELSARRRIMDHPHAILIGHAIEEHLRDGHVGHLTNDHQDFCLTIQRHEHPEED